MTRVRADRVPHLTEDQAMPEVARWVRSGEPISDAAALAIASWWQGPTGYAGHLATLAGSQAVDLDELRWAIRRTLAEDARSVLDRQPLAALRAWAEGKTSTSPVCVYCGAPLSRSIADRRKWSHFLQEDWSSEHHAVAADGRQPS